MVSDTISSFFVLYFIVGFFFFFSSRRRHTRLVSDWSSDVCSSDLSSNGVVVAVETRQTGVIQLAEYEVEFKGGVRRRFLDFQLSIFPEKRRRAPDLKGKQCCR